MNDPIITAQGHQIPVRASRLFPNASPDLYNRLLTTEEAAQATGLSQYELRRGAEEGRYPCILLGSPKNKFRKRRWNLTMLTDAIMRQGNQAGEA